MKRIIKTFLFLIVMIYFSSCDVYTDFLESENDATPVTVEEPVIEEPVIEYNLRDIGPAGGWIFHIIDNGDGTKTYYEAAPVDQGASVEWINSGPAPNPQETVNGNTGTAVGTGWDNTLAIIAQTNHTSSAALLCRSYNGGGFNDWYLPSKDELERIFWNLRGMAYNTVYNPEVPDAAGGGVGNISGSYWTSSEWNIANPYQIWMQQGINGYQTYMSKSNLYKVRAVRSFIL